MFDDLLEAIDDETFGLRVHLVPAAGRSAVVGRHGDALKVRVAAPPEGGRANEACTKLLAETFGVAPSQVELVSGAGSRLKRFRVKGVELEEAQRLLERAIEADGPPAGRQRAR